MSNKKYKNTYYITNEIDYEKLAKAIVTALDNHEQSKNTKSSTTSLFSLLCTIIFVILGAFMAVLAVTFVLIPWAAYLGYWNGNYKFWGMFIPTILLTAFSALFSVLLFNSAHELSTEKDKNIVVSVFSSMVGVAAMVIAAASLFSPK